MDLGNQIEKSVTAAEPSLGPPPAKKSCSSSVWKHFTVIAVDKTKVICNVCKSQISRGRDIKRLSTSAMHNNKHLKHPLPVLSANSPTSTNPPTSTNSLSQPCSAPACQFKSPVLAAFNAKQAYPPNHPTAKHTNSNTNTNTNFPPPQQIQIQIQIPTALHTPKYHVLWHQLQKKAQPIFSVFSGNVAAVSKMFVSFYWIDITLLCKGPS